MDLSAPPKTAQGSTPEAKALTAGQRQMQQLKKRIKRPELKTHILKKVSALLASEHLRKL